jgi:hypothetical protein
MADETTGFDELTLEGKLSAIYGQALSLHEKVNDLLARQAQIEAKIGITPPPETEGSDEDQTKV